MEHPYFALTMYALLASAAMAREWSNSRFPGDPVKIWNIFEDNESIADLAIELHVCIAMIRKAIHPDSRALLSHLPSDNYTDPATTTTPTHLTRT